MNRDIMPILELLENEQLTVREAARAIEDVLDGGHPELPEPCGALAKCEKCGLRMSTHDVWDRCPGSTYFGQAIGGDYA